MENTAAEIKRKVYDNRIVTFAPLYTGNYCVNNCAYCGFRSGNETLVKKRILSMDEIKSESKVPAGKIGHKRLIVVYGEHPLTDTDYISESIQNIYSVKVKTKNEVTIIVYGTEFRFFTRERGSKVELNKGVIKLHYKEGKSKKTIALNPGESISLNKENRLTERSTFNPSRNIELKKHRFVFDNTPLSELKNLISENFGLGIIIPDKEIEKLTLTGTYTGNNLNELINSLSAVTGLNFYRHHDEDHVYLSLDADENYYFSSFEKHIFKIIKQLEKKFTIFIENAEFYAFECKHFGNQYKYNITRNKENNNKIILKKKVLNWEKFDK